MGYVEGNSPLQGRPMKTFIFTCIAFSSLTAFARVDCTLTVREESQVYRHVEIGPMISRFSLKMLVGGQMLNKKIGFNMGSDSTDEAPTGSLITISYNDMNELVDMGTFKRGKKLHSMTFSALQPQTVKMEMGDVPAGEETATVVCEVQ